MLSIKRPPIPIYPLLEKRLVNNSRDLSIELETDHTLSLAPFEHITETLGLDTSKSTENHVVPLRRTLSTLLKANQALKHLPYAEKMYNGYKYNCLVQIQLAVMELVVMNSSEVRNSYGGVYSSYKQQLIEVCISGLGGGINRGIAYAPLFIKKLRDKIGKRLWLENCNENNVTFDRGCLRVGTQKIDSFQGDVGTLASVFRNSLRVFCLEEGNYRLLETISDLQKVIGEAIEATAKEIGGG